MQQSTIRGKRDTGMKRVVAIGEEKVRVECQLFQRFFVSPSLLLLIFGHQHDRINHENEIKAHAKNTKVIHFHASTRLSELLTASSECVAQSLLLASLGFMRVARSTN